MSDVTYVTDGPWGTGTHTPHTAASADLNFWILESLITALQDAQPDTIAFFTVTGNQMWITMTDHFVFGPFSIPTSVWNFRGPWVPNSSYAVNDVFTANGGVYLVIFPQLDSGATFYNLANDGLGHNFYGLLLAAPPSVLPDDGLPGQFLQWTALDSPGGVAWAYVNRPIGVYIEQPPEPMEVIRYVFAESTLFPVGLTGSQASAGTYGTGTQVYGLFQNGASVGSVNFNEGTHVATFTFPAAITFHAGDVLTIVAPTVPDGHMTQISITLLGQVVLP